MGSENLAQWKAKNSSFVTRIIHHWTDEFCQQRWSSFGKSEFLIPPIFWDSENLAQWKAKNSSFVTRKIRHSNKISSIFQTHTILRFMQKFFEILELIDRLDGLIRRKATGKPSQLARRLNVCERKVYQLIDMLRNLGAPVAYCSQRESYYYEIDVEFRRDLFVQKVDAEKIKGGESFLREFWVLHDLCSEEG